MIRKIEFDKIEERLLFLAYRIGIRSRLNLLELNIHSENFFAEVLNILFDWDLHNANELNANYKGIDLIDISNKIIVQVSATNTKQKVENTLERVKDEKYCGYELKILFVSGEIKNIVNKSYNIDNNIKFNPQEDIWDIGEVLRKISNLTDINKREKIYDLVMNEIPFGKDIDILKVDSNITEIINILSKENLDNVSYEININLYEIDKKIEFNNLNEIVKILINDYKIYYEKVNEKYREFDLQGVNKSFSVLQAIRKKYIELLNVYEESNELFFMLIREIINLVKNSKNYIDIPYEELEICVTILVVDAFIKCKIFKNPEGYKFV